MTQHISSYPGGNYIGGEWLPAGGPPLVSRNPADGQRLWSGYESTADDVARAIEAARAARQAWAALGLENRVEMVRAFEQCLAARADEVSRAICREVGKPLWDASTEVQAMLAKVAISIEALHARRDPTSISLGTARGLTRYKPHGVFAVFGPFNFPGHISHGHLIPALLAGNTIVFKPSELTPRVAEILVRLWETAGLPPGVLNLVQGGRQTGAALVEHPDINGVLFTGSLRVGQAIARALAERLDVLFALELGGNNPLVVHRVGNVDAAVYDTLRSAYLSGGQRCTCARRLIVPEGNSEFLTQLVERLPCLRTGPPEAQPQPFIGSLIHARAVQQVLAEQERLIAAGGRVLVPARVLEHGPAFVSPGLIDVTDVADRGDEEVFGPLLQLIRVPDFAAAIEEANRTRFGLVAGLLCDERPLFEEFYRDIDAGLINWNMPTTGASGKLPFGGTRLSGNHRPAGYFTVDFCNVPVASMESETLALPTQLLPGVDWC
ncbi:MAG: succinylglutamate-semialdehyde dehydrogenase [Planctomycetaceae bacterium]|nr:succinylglutamate-semialdehyde dehydrogenase [Planctomycetaceae bacterium]